MADAGGAAKAEADVEPQSVERRFGALYCPPHAKVVGELCVSPSAVRFAAEKHAPDGHAVVVEVQDVLECGALALPLEDPYFGEDPLAASPSGSAPALTTLAEFLGEEVSDRRPGDQNVGFFLQLHVSTQDGRTFRGRDDALGEPWRVVFRLRSRADLYEAARVVLDAQDVGRRDGGQEAGRATSSTSVPFLCADCVASLDRGPRPPRRPRLPAPPGAASPDGSPHPPAAAASASAVARRAWDLLAGPVAQALAPSAAQHPVPSVDEAGARKGGRRKKRPTAAASTGSPASASSASSGAVPRPGRVALRAGDAADGGTLLTPALADCIADFLPVGLRLPGAVEWVLRYTPKAHGVSLTTLYRNLAESEKTILMVKDADARVFGGFALAPWEPQGKFYGSGEAFVFAFTGLADPPEMAFYPWTTANSFIQYSDNDVLAMGGGDGRHALAVRSDLLHGLSSPTPTFGNPTLAASEEFVVRDIELWAIEEVEFE